MLPNLIYSTEFLVFLIIDERMVFVLVVWQIHCLFVHMHVMVRKIDFVT